MLLDNQNLFCDNQAVTAAATAVSTNTIDLGVTGTKAGGDSPISDPGRAVNGKILAQVTETFAGGTNVTVNLISSAAANLGSPTVLQSTGAILTAKLKAGYQFRFDGIPPGVEQRYLGLQIISVGTHTAGKITAGIVWDKQTTNPR